MNGTGRAIPSVAFGEAPGRRTACMRESNRLRVWLIIASVVVLFHLFLLVYVKPSSFSFLLPSPRTPADESPGAASTPDAILYVPVEYEEPAVQETVTHLIEESEAEETVEPSQDTRPPQTGPQSGVPADIGDIIGDASRPLPRGVGKEPVKIPPRPLQITWPDTRRLKHCRGHQIDLRIEVDVDGRILRVEPAVSSSPAECIRAALECAAKIVFAPGQINGRPARMWTEIRIDFRKKN